ncbi:hypothetical protein GGF50DRAFT_61894, partial [Schizophyllum commune]
MTSNRLDSTLPTTPSHEWAQVTAAELAQQQAKVDHQATLATAKTTGPTTVTTTTRRVSPPGTPGPDIPGAYPGSDPEDAKPEETLAAAATYLPARKDVEQTLADATRVAKQYLPEQVAGLIPGAIVADLPSKEGPNERLGTTDGVGALPGSSSEASVAKLPDERFEGEKRAVAYILSVLTSPCLGSTHVSLPSKEGANDGLGTTGGVGALPGNKSE